MTLVVSLRVTDGVVIAADSLATSFQALKLQVATNAQCPHCTTDVHIPDVMQNLRGHPPCPSCSKPVPIDSIPEPRLNLPISATSYAQKVFPFLNHFAVAQFGATAIGTRTVYSYMKDLENSLQEERRRNPSAAVQFRQIAYVADRLQSALQTIFDQQYPQADRGATFPEILFGIQVVGFIGSDNPVPATVEISFGRNTRSERHDGLGITTSGDWSFSHDFVALCAKHNYNPEVAHFSLQDAIDYSEFVVATMAGMQRFAATTATVGGAIDIGLLAPYSTFRWIKAKPLARILEPESGAAI